MTKAQTRSSRFILSGTTAQGSTVRDSYYKDKSYASQSDDTIDEVDTVNSISMTPRGPGMAIQVQVETAVQCD